VNRALLEFLAKPLAEGQSPQKKAVA
jgi:hypothetical protein